MTEPDLSFEAALDALEDATARHGGDPDLLAMYAEEDDRHRWTGSIVLVSGSRSEHVPISDDLAMPARLRIERGSTTVDVDATGEHPRYVVSFETASPTVLRRLHLQALVEQAISHVTVTTHPTPMVWSTAAERSKFERTFRDPTFLEGIRAGMERLNRKYPKELPEGTRTDGLEDAKQFVRRRTSQRAMDEAARQAADVYPTGGIAAVQRVLLASERQSWRYVKRAQELELLPRQRAPRKGRES